MWCFWTLVFNLNFYIRVALNLQLRWRLGTALSVYTNSSTQFPNHLFVDLTIFWGFSSCCMIQEGGRWSSTTENIELFGWNFSKLEHSLSHQLLWVSPILHTKQPQFKCFSHRQTFQLQLPGCHLEVRLHPLFTSPDSADYDRTTQIYFHPPKKYCSNIKLQMVEKFNIYIWKIKIFHPTAVSYTHLTLPTNREV